MISDKETIIELQKKVDELQEKLDTQERERLDTFRYELKEFQEDIASDKAKIRLEEELEIMVDKITNYSELENYILSSDLILLNKVFSPQLSKIILIGQKVDKSIGLEVGDTISIPNTYTYGLFEFEGKTYRAVRTYLTQKEKQNE